MPSAYERPDGKRARKFYSGVPDLLKTEIEDIRRMKMSEFMFPA
jgi:predicted enzyme related to lactoylglutathione lyase